MSDAAWLAEKRDRQAAEAALLAERQRRHAAEAAMSAESERRRLMEAKAAATRKELVLALQNKVVVLEKKKAEIVEGMGLRAPPPGKLDVSDHSLHGQVLL